MKQSDIDRMDHLLSERDDLKNCMNQLTKEMQSFLSPELPQVLATLNREIEDIFYLYKNQLNELRIKLSQNQINLNSRQSNLQQINSNISSLKNELISLNTQNLSLQTKINETRQLNQLKEDEYNTLVQAKINLINGMSLNQQAFILQNAIETDNNDIKILFASLDLNSLSIERMPLLFYYTHAYHDQKNKMSIINYLLKQKADPNISDPSSGFYPIQRAVLNSDINLVKVLTENNADINAINIKEKITSLYCATISGDQINNISIIKYLLAQKADPNIPQYSEFYPLHAAVQHGNLQAVKLLTENNANVNIINVRNNTIPLYWALWNAEQNNTMSIINYLLEHKANPNSKVREDGETLMHVAVHHNNSQLIKDLLDYNGDFNIKDNKGITPLYLYIINESTKEKMTPLQYAIKYDIDVINYLLEQKADPNISDSLGYYPIHSAVHNQDLETIQSLIKHNAIVDNVCTKKGMTPLHSAINYGSIVIINYLLEQDADPNIPDSSGNYPIHSAVKGCNLKIIKALVENNADVNKVSTIEGVTALHYAIKYILNYKIKYTSYYNIKYNSIDIIRYLLEQKANPNIPDAVGYYPIHSAVNSCINLNVVKILLNNNANIDEVCNKEGMTPLHYAVKYGNGNIINYLLEQNADPNISNALGYHPIHTAIQKNHLYGVIILVRNNVNINEVCTKEGMTPLYYAVKHNNVNMIEYLLEQNADLNIIINITGLHLIHIAAQKGFLNVVQSLVKNNVNINEVCTKEGMTPLHYAVKYNNVNIIEYLLKCEADHNAVDSLGLQPIQIAIQAGNLDTILALVENNIDVNIEELTDRVKILALKADAKKDIDYSFDFYNQIFRIYNKIGLYDSEYFKLIVSNLATLSLLIDDLHKFIVLKYKYNTNLNLNFIKNFTNFVYYDNILAYENKILIRAQSVLQQISFHELINTKNIDQNNIFLLSATIAYMDALIEKTFFLYSFSEILSKKNLEQKSNPDISIPLEFSSMHIALQNGNLDAIMVLIEDNEDINVEEFTDKIRTLSLKADICKDINNSLRFHDKIFRIYKKIVSDDSIHLQTAADNLATISLLTDQIYQFIILKFKYKTNLNQDLINSFNLEVKNILAYENKILIKVQSILQQKNLQNLFNIEDNAQDNIWLTPEAVSHVDTLIDKTLFLYSFNEIITEL